MSTLDYILILAYLIIVIGFGLYKGWRQDKLSYFVNRRDTNRILLLASLISTNAGAATFLGIAGTAFDSGISYGVTNIFIVCFGFVLFSLYADKIASLSRQENYITVGDFLYSKYRSKSVVVLASAVLVVSYMLFLAAQMTALGHMLSMWSEIRMEYCIVLASMSMVIYTAIAGIRSDFYTDVIHFVVIAIFFLVIIPFTLLPKIDVSQCHHPGEHDPRAGLVGCWVTH